MRFYRVEATGEACACKTCGHGEYWDIVHGENGEPVAESTSYQDKEQAEEIASLMNDAFDRGYAERGKAVGSVMPAPPGRSSVFKQETTVTTVEYLRSLIETFKAARPEGTTPEIERFAAAVEQVEPYLMHSIQSFTDAGAP